jgi:Meiotically up-regulated gene 113
LDKQQIVAEIRRLALDNGGRAPGSRAFESATGVKKSEWYPHVWLRWGEALSEAGYPPNVFQEKITDDALLEKYVALSRDLGKFPLEGEIRRKAREDASFPSHSTFARFGGKEKLLQAVEAYCRKAGGLEEVLELCERRKTTSTQTKTGVRKAGPKIPTELVYLMKSGKHYKIGRTNSVGRRRSELAIKIPVPPTTVHSVETDDPIGVEAYWHKRFADKRGEGEWFVLSQEDIKAFKRWKRIV